MAGLGAEIYRRLGATVVLLPAAEIVPSLRSGAIDACEWVGPWLDMEIGLHEAASHYYHPGWHEPGAAVTLGIRSDVWESLSSADRGLFETACAAEFALSLAEFSRNNAFALERMRSEGVVTIARFSDELLEAFAEIASEVVAEIGSHDELSKRIFDSHQGFRRVSREWTRISDARGPVRPRRRSDGVVQHPR